MPFMNIGVAWALRFLDVAVILVAPMPCSDVLVPRLAARLPQGSTVQTAHNRLIERVRSRPEGRLAQPTSNVGGAPADRGWRPWPRAEWSCFRILLHKSY
jgi:hypothetical protein